MSEAREDHPVPAEGDDAPEQRAANSDFTESGEAPIPTPQPDADGHPTGPREPAPEPLADPEAADAAGRRVPPQDTPPGRFADREAHEVARPRRAIHQGGFGASLGWALAGTVLPGAGLLGTSWKLLGALLIVAAALGLVGVLTALFSPTTVLGLMVMPGALTAAWIAAAAFGVVWAFSIVATHLLRRPANPGVGKRILGTLVVGVLTFAVLAPSFLGARALHDTATLLDRVTGATPTGQGTAPQWTDQGRLNILVLGGDSGQARAEELGARTDTVILASIDSRTGDTVLFSLPRQTQHMPFPAGSPLAQRWPNGFNGGSLEDANYALNAMYDNVKALAPELMPTGVQNPSAEVLKMSVGEALGLHVDYYAMINMDGFIDFIDALGGVTVNINTPIPVGGKTTGNIPPDRWLPPGPDQHLNGTDALWFARGRYGFENGDYARMARQRCVIQAVVKQANPATVAANYEALSKASGNIVATDVPDGQLPRLFPLAMKVKDGSMTSVSFVHGQDGFSTVRPDWNLVRQRVQNAINPPAPTATPSSTAPATPTASTSPSASASASASGSPTPTPSSTPASLVDECAYNPQPLKG